MRVGQHALAGLGDADGNAGRVHQRPERRLRLGVEDAAPGDEERPLRAEQQRHRRRQVVGVGLQARDSVHALLEEARGVVVRLGLHVLGEREGDRAVARGVG